MLDRTNSTVRSIKKSGIRRFSEAASQLEGVVSLTIGEPEFDTPEAIKEAAFKALKENKTHYPVGVGVSALRKAISDFESKDASSMYRPEEVIVTVGSTEALATIFLGLLEEGDEVIIPEPMYTVYTPMVEVTKAKVIALDTTVSNFQLDANALSACITPKTKMILITSPNNPSGVVYTQESLDAVARLAIEHRLFVVSDDVYNQLVYMDHYPSLRQYPALRPHLIVAQSFSKPYAMTGWRIGYILADQPIANVLGTFHPYLVSGIPPFIQEAAIEALNHDTTWMKDLYRQRRDNSLALLKQMNIPCVYPEGAFYLFIDVSEFNMDSEQFCFKALNDYKLAMVPGVYFGSHCDHYVRLSYATSEDQLYEGLNRLKNMVHDLRKP